MAEYPTAVIGSENPLPPLAFTADLHDSPAVDGLDEDMQRNIAYGRSHSILPYRLQDNYGRELEQVRHPVAVVENELLRATFLPGMGGRLWSLIDRSTGRELLYSNAAIQPGNLALRNAWIAGGVEWNIGTTGHTPLTSSLLHAARVVLNDGTEVLRMYEFERSRELIYQVDAWLPRGSAALLVTVRVTNPNDHEVPLYWWSNIAVPEHSGTRVIADADSAWQFDYGNGLRRVGFPILDGVDRSYPTRSDTAADYFFDLRGAAHPWIAAIDDDGSGLLHTSTRELQGRKLFLWGSGQGGRHWQEWLSPLGGNYLEIQAGLARTQLEHLPLAAGETRSWTESYGPIEIARESVHGNWEDARKAVAAEVQRTAPPEWLAGRARDAAAFADRPPTELLQIGSGWGALENRRRSVAGTAPFDTAGTPFLEASLGPEQEPWLELLGKRTMSASPGNPPSSYQVSAGWLSLLVEAHGWQAHLHRGVALAYSGDLHGAVGAWQESFEAEPNAWALRNQAVLRFSSDPALALGLYDQAVPFARGCEPLLLERLVCLALSSSPQKVLGAVDALPAGLRRAPRVQLLEATAAVQVHEVDRAGGILDEGLVLPQLREGALELGELWYEYRALRLAAKEGVPLDERHQTLARRESLPWAYEFRMKAT